MSIDTPELNNSTTSQPMNHFRNESPSDFSKSEMRKSFKEAMQRIEKMIPVKIPLLIDGSEIEKKETLTSHNPADKEQLLAEYSCASRGDIDDAVKVARGACEEWSHTPVEERASILLKTSELIRQQKHDFSAIIVLESGKPWREADADVDEAIDFLEFYSREAMRLSGRRRLQPYLLGEHNDIVYQSLGVVGVIGPWNFPMAIPVGMSCAALAAGNTVLLKPAEQTPLIAWLYVKMLEKAGLPRGVMNFVPGRGEDAGDQLVRHHDVNMIVFTGSREVGLMITRAASEVQEGQTFVKRAVTEMGGKNAIIVDSSADIDSSVPDVIYSAFGFSGQKCSACSRLILLDDLYDEYVDRLVEGVSSLKVGDPRKPGTQMGPVIDEEAQAKIEGYIKLGKENARLLYEMNLDESLKKGFFVPPVIFEVDSHDHPLMQEEIFGPVLAVYKVGSFEEALRVANSTPYALTGGVHSRTPSNLERARIDYQCGNLYLNRTITGAIVGRQPFGGFKLSGVGSKAGGPDYLKQFLVSRVISENMMRHGMASLVEGEEDFFED